MVSLKRRWPLQRCLIREGLTVGPKETYPHRFRAQEMRKDQAVRSREERAWRLAYELADLLKGSFHARRVVVFGSLAQLGAFSNWSDIDLAAWGIPVDRFYAAVAAVTGVSAESKVDLVDPADCKLPLRRAIEDQGVEVGLEGA